jgi:predicted ATPase/transcriptional regulator with GAF, ATPase, and Fis domain/tRNA A-37 threonylcarbamoyl transferase component Bud32
MPTGYTVHEKLHDGNRRTVHRAVRDRDQARVIIKSLEVAVATEQDVAAVRREFDILNSLDVDGVPEAHDLVSHANGFDLVLEDRGGTPLAEYMRSATYDLAKRLDIAIAVATVLDGVHRQRVVHRDLNPNNVLVDATGAVSLVDFSIARQQAEDHPPVSDPAQLEGTLAYLSPEQTGRMNRPVDYRSDFYSLGITMFELCSGQLPFQAGDPMQLVHCHIAVPPPRLEELRKDVPWSVGAVIGKLLEKAPEDRYQSAAGIVHDLRWCRDHVHDLSLSFRPGHQDIRDRFSIPRKLYGREEELGTLMKAFDRASQGGVELMLVAGTSGIGKSALVHAVEVPLAERRGYFVSGKFDQLRLTVPYSAVVVALGALVGQLLTESDDALQAWKVRVLEALDGQGQLVIDLIPKMRHVIGPQPPVPDLAVAESRNRFARVFQHFIRVFCQPEHPLVIFLDDLQWVDPASLALLDSILTDDESHHLLVIAAYRENEVDAAHPFMAAVTALSSDPHVSVNKLAVGPLPPRSVTQLLSDTFQGNSEPVDRLQRLLVEKTAGNPFFLRQFLTALHHKGKLTFDYSRNGWVWDIDELEAMNITTNVADLMVTRLEELDVDTIRTLRLAACVGSRFDLATLALIAPHLQGDVSGGMRPAIEAGLVIPDRGSATQHGGGDVAPESTRLRFLHDRVQQAAYGMLDEPAKREAHLRIGSLLQSSVADVATSERLFEIVDHLNIGRDLVVEPAKRLNLARLNLDAARRAVAATAYAAASDYAAGGLVVLPDERWQTDYELTLGLHRVQVDAEYLRGDFEASQQLIKDMRPRLRTHLEQAEILGALVVQQTLSGLYRPAIDSAREALALLGVDIPVRDVDATLSRELGHYTRAMDGREPQALLELPDTTSPDTVVALRLLAALCPLGYIAEPLLWRVAATKMVNLSLAQGHTPDSAVGYAFFGLLHSAVLHSYRSAYDYGRLGIALAEQYADASQLCKTTHMFCAFINQWSRHFREFDADNRRGFQAGLQSGEHQYAGYHRYNRALCLFHLGTNLQALIPELQELLRFGRTTRNQHATDPIVGVMRAALDLAGETPEPGTFIFEQTSEPDFLGDLVSRDARPALCHYHVIKCQVLYVYGRIDDAQRCAERAATGLLFVPGHMSVAVHAFYASLIAVEAMERAGDGVQAEQLDAIKGWLHQLQRWADSCPDNFLHKSLLVAAEVARLEGDLWQAAELYDRAIDEASRSGYRQEEALAHERAGLFWLAQHRHKMAAVYLNEAQHGYQLWGASRKARMLADAHADLIAGTPATSRRESGPSMPFFTLLSSTGAALDFATVMKASQTISKEVDLEALVKKLVKIAVETAGAQRGHLLLLKEGKLGVEASSTFETGERRYRPSLPVDAVDDLPASIVHYVTRTKELLTLADAAADSRFSGDAVVRRSRSRSVLCVPITNRGDMVGVLYLEHNLVSGAFTSDRVAIVQSLAAQAAISLENAGLYDEQKKTERNLRDALEELQRLKNQLEAENWYLQEEVGVNHGEILGESAAIKNVLKAIETVASTDVNVVITGETGTGKELVARAIHQASERAQKTLIKVNSASIPKELFESEFFGHVKGAFTGALRDRVGRFELADTGTLFLDEVAEIPLDMQSKLLRVLQEGEFERVGEERTRTVDVRILAATNRDLKQEVDAGRFRQDLYYRLNVFPIEVPPLSQRDEDIPRLAAHYLRHAAGRLKRPCPTLTQANVLQLLHYDWPGNVRELQNVIERAVIVSGAGPLHLDLPSITAKVPPSMASPATPTSSAEVRVVHEDKKREQDRDNILAALQKTNWKIAGKHGAAELLGLRPSTLASRIKRLGIVRGD